MNKQKIEQLQAFYYVKSATGYTKRHITLKALVSQLSEKRLNAGAAAAGKYHSTSDFATLDADDHQRRQTETL